MDYLYQFGNASLTLRVIEYLQAHPELPLEFVTVIHQLNGWLVRIKMMCPLHDWQERDLQAFLNELGIACPDDLALRLALWDLESGQLPAQVMQRYHVAIVAHGRPNLREIKTFREQFIQGLGYCPETLA
jgi:hypothetical protein